MSNADRLIQALVQIEKVLLDEQYAERKDGKYVGLSRLIRDSKKLSDRQKSRLISLAELRNTIVHEPRNDAHEVIAEPRDDVIEWVEQQVQIIVEPPLVVTVLGLEPPTLLDEACDLVQFLELVRLHHFSQSPVRTREGGLRLITTNAVARWVAEQYVKGDGVALEAITIEELEPFSEEGDRLELGRRNLTAIQAVRIFSGQTGRPIPAAIVLTENGKAHETPVGICTASDVAKLLAALGVYGARPM